MCAVTLLGFDGNPFDQRSVEGGGRFMRCHLRLKLTGSYTTGGDTLDFSNGGGTPAAPSTVPPAAANNAAVGPDQVNMMDGPTIAGTVSANGGYYVIIKGTNPTNWKLKVFATAGSEYGAGAYGTDATTDTPEMEAIWSR